MEIKKTVKQMKETNELQEKTKYKSKKLNSLLLERIPEFKEIFDEETSWQDGIETGCFLIFDGPLTRFIVERMSNRELVSRFFKLTEEMLSEEGSYEENVAHVGVWENLVYNYDPRIFFDYIEKATKNYEVMHYYITEKLKFYI